MNGRVLILTEQQFDFFAHGVKSDAALISWSQGALKMLQMHAAFDQMAIKTYQRRRFLSDRAISRIQTDFEIFPPRGESVPFISSEQQTKSFSCHLHCYFQTFFHSIHTENAALLKLQCSSWNSDSISVVISSLVRQLSISAVRDVKDGSICLCGSVSTLSFTSTRL